MPDTRDRVRIAGKLIVWEEPSPLLYDSWRVCPNCGASERDGNVIIREELLALGCQECGRFTGLRWAPWEVERR